jgi:hypothetical protein
MERLVSTAVAQSWTVQYYFFLFGRCVRAEPAEVFELLLALPLRNVFEAAVPALEDVTLLGALVCDSAEPAADLAALLELLLRNTFDAADAARLLVTSRFGIIFYLKLLL